MNERKFVLLAVTAVGSSLCLYYVIRKTSKKEYHIVFDGSQVESMTVELKLQTSFLPFLFGQKGDTLKKIEDKTNTVINFRCCKDEKYAICSISGFQSNVKLAEDLIKEAEGNYLKIGRSEISVPEEKLDLVLGRNLDNFNQIQQESGAVILFERRTYISKKGGFRKFIIKGTPEQMLKAKNIIENVIENNRSGIERNRIEEFSSEGHTSKDFPSKGPEDCNAFTWVQGREMITEILNNTEDYIDVFVSAVASPDKFWIQIAGPLTSVLDNLVTEMTSFYREENNASQYRISVPNIGAIVAAIFPADGEYYRGAIMKLDDEKKTVSVFFVDFGDSDEVPQSEVFELLPEFSQLRFQAIECQLGGVLPRDLSWSSEAIEDFGLLSLCAQWKELRLKVLKHRSVTGRPTPIPVVKLVNPEGEKAADISEELIRKGHAVEEDINLV
ncbi:tudor and KH domain-containing protein homolog isoform X2 [Artemia franciscana]